MRNRFDDEKKYKWLTSLLDAYALADEGVASTVKHAEAAGTPIACSKGCDACCRNPDVPITQPELQGISWFASERLTGPLREVVKSRLLNHAATIECPFLVNGACAIYEARPLACRQFLVKNKQCSIDEEIWETRREDITYPARSSTQKVAIELLTFWDFPNRKAKLDAFASGFIPKAARSMHEYDWALIASTMTAVEKARSKAA